MSIRLNVNGRDVELDVYPGERLSQVLRDRLGLKGTKVGCDAGDCGACSVMIDGELACACLTATGQAAGCNVVTVEGLVRDGALSELQERFLVHGAAQCGICTPGMLMAARALLDRNPAPSRAEVQDALGGVLCRCTGYARIVDAVLGAAERTKAGTRNAEDAAIGAAIRHVDGPPKVTGQTRFGADQDPAGALLARVVRSPHHRARFSIGDRTAFLDRFPGILAVLDAGDVPGRNCHGTIPPFADQPVFAEGEVRFRGEAIALVVGEPEAVRAFDPAAFPVEWEVLEPVLTPEAARSADVQPLHASRPGNVLVRGIVERGDVAAGLDRSQHRLAGRFATPFIEHAYIEPEAGHAVRRGNRIEVHGCTQTAHMNRDELAAILGLAQEQVRVVPSACGGGFGSKLDLSWQPYVAIAAWILGRPVTIAYSRTESMMSTTKRHPAEIVIEAGCDGQGRITAVEFEGVFNTGAYASWGPTVANRVPVHASGPYFVPSYRALSVAVHTHTMPAGAFRGFGVPQATIAQECIYDELADKAGIDRLEFRLINALDNGMPTVTGQVFASGVGIRACLEALRPAWRAARARVAGLNRDFEAQGSPLRKGYGIGTCWYGCGNTSLPNPSTIRIGVTRRGRIVLHQGAIDIGQGANTVIAQIAAEALGVPVAAFDLAGADTDITPDAGKTSASRQTFISGNAARLSAEALKARILRHANVSAEARLRFGDGVIEVADAVNVARVPLADLPENELGYVFMAEESYDPPTRPLDAKGQGEPYALYGYGAQLVELTVDTRLGTVTLDRITAAHDVGRAINPMLAEGQIEGGIAQGIGLALMEEYVPGRTENLHDYLIPTIGDVPPIESILVEVPDPNGPFGAKGLGEHVLIPTAPAILNAIRDATGARIRRLPATPDKVLAAIREVRNHD